MISYSGLMEKLGECIDKLNNEHFPKAETELCSKAANAVYLMLLCVNEIQKCGDEGQKEAAEKCAQECAEQIEWAMNSYLAANYPERMERIEEGMRAIHSFLRAKKKLTDICRSAMYRMGY